MTSEERRAGRDRRVRVTSTGVYQILTEALRLQASTGDYLDAVAYSVLQRATEHPTGSPGNNRLKECARQIEIAAAIARGQV
jgi:DNA-binding NarL/FixJ family response regulator